MTTGSDQSSSLHIWSGVYVNFGEYNLNVNSSAVHLVFLSVFDIWNPSEVVTLTWKHERVDVYVYILFEKCLDWINQRLFEPENVLKYLQIQFSNQSEFRVLRAVLENHTREMGLC